MRAIADLRDADEREDDWRPVFAAAMAVILCLFGAGLGWAMYARLDSAIVAHGVLLAESERKSVEHFEGGILEEMLVRPGDRVQAGQVVATLAAVQTRELLAQLETERVARDFDLWRLEAERDGADPDPRVAPQAPQPLRDAAIGAQLQLFEARRRSHVGQIAALRRRADQLAAEQRANAAQADAAEAQLALLGEERAMIAQLVDRGASPRQRLMEFDRGVSVLAGERDERRSLVAAAESGAAEAAAQIDTIVQQRLVEIGERIEEARRARDAVSSRIRAAEDVLERHRLRAPQDGVVVDVSIVTPGAVVASGVPLMTILPDGDRLVAEARLPPEAIDTVHVGRKAEVRLIAYRRAEAPVVDGEVIYVSADILEDPRDGEPYFSARVSLDAAQTQALEGVELSAGMPVEIMIETGERRAGDYFLEPILNQARRAFREE